MLRRVFRYTIRTYRTYAGVYLVTSHSECNIQLLPSFGHYIYVWSRHNYISNKDLKWSILATFGDMIFANSAFQRPQCIRSKFWHIMWLKIFYVQTLHDFWGMYFSTFWALNCCFWLYFAFYATYEWFEALLVVQRVLRHAISTSKAYFDIGLV